MGLLLLSHYAETRYLTRMLEIGTSSVGYRLKDKVASVTALSDTLNRIADGELVLEPGPDELGAAARDVAAGGRGRRVGVAAVPSVRPRIAGQPERRAAPCRRPPGSLASRHRGARAAPAGGQRPAW